MKAKRENTKKYTVCMLLNGCKIDGVSTFANQLTNVLRNYKNMSCITINIDSNLKKKICSLAKEIKDSSSITILSNIWPAYFMLEMIKSVLPNSRIVHIVHDLPWMTFFNGDCEAFIKESETGFSSFEKPFKNLLYYSTIDTLKAFELCDDVVCLCEDTIDIVHEVYGIPLNKLHLIRNGSIDFYKIDTPYSTKNPDVTKMFDRSFYNLIFIGRPTFSKGWDRVIELGNHIKDYEKAMRVICVGSNEFENFIPEHLTEFIINGGILSHKKIHDALRHSDAVFIPSRHEQCSYVGIESMMHSKEIFIYGGHGLNNMFNENNSHIISRVCQISPNLNMTGINARHFYEFFTR